MIAPAAVALSTLLAQCAPAVGQRTMTAIVRVESNANPLAMYDNTTGRSISPPSFEDALITAQTLIDKGHSVDLGLAQVNSANLPRLHMSVRAAFDPCSNLKGAAVILQSAYLEAAARFSPGPFALRRAIGAYNTGSIYAGDGYIDRILVAAGLPPQGDQRMPDLENPVPQPMISMPYAPSYAPASVPAPAPAIVSVVHRRPQPPKPVAVAPAGPDPFAAPLMVVNNQGPTPEALGRVRPATEGSAPGTLPALKVNPPGSVAAAQPASAQTSQPAAPAAPAQPATVPAPSSLVVVVQKPPSK